MTYRVGPRTVFTASVDPFQVLAVIEGYVMDFVAGVQALQHFERSYLATTVGRMKEIRLHPQNPHTWTGTGSSELCSGMMPSDQRSLRPVRNKSPHSCRFSNRQMRSVASSSS